MIIIIYAKILTKTNNIMLLQILNIFFNFYVLFIASFYGPALLLLLFDYITFLPNFRIDRKTNIINTYKKCINTVLINTFLSSIPPILFLSIFIYTFDLDKQQFIFSKMFLDVVCATILVDITFYMMHRLLHTRILYKRFHKKHHEITEPVGISALYMTTMDMYFGNILPIYLPLMIMFPHKITLQFWLVFTTVNTVFGAHSGYVKIGTFHDDHHKLFCKNYGTDIFMDKLFGTNY